MLVGEVWVGSGQSNMQMVSAAYVKGDPTLAKNLAVAPYPKIRIASATKPWAEATEKNLSNFSALLFSFGLPLQTELDVPVGLMVGAVGGTSSGYWVSQEAVDADPACQAAIAAASANDGARANYAKRLAEWEAKLAAAKAKGQKGLPRGNPWPLEPGQCGRDMGHLYDAHIRPLQPYGIRGVLWDQGESGTNVEGVDQYTLTGALIRGWRKDWAQGEFPFIYVQKPSGAGCAWEKAPKPIDLKVPSKVPQDGGYVENHIRIMEHPNTAMVTSSDLGSGIHPPDKSAYGKRAATVALATVYDRPVECYGPMFASHAVDEEKIRVSFTHTGQGLAFKHGEKLQGFAIAGDDKVFHWADAIIDGDTVVVTSPAVPKPVAVRYAWSKSHPWAHLFNNDGLPAVPFRTDQW